MVQNTDRCSGSRCWTLTEGFCRVAGRAHPRPATSEACMGVSIHTTQASAKASFGTGFHNCISGRLMIFTAIAMVHLKVACGVRPALSDSEWHRIYAHGQESADEMLGQNSAARRNAVLPDSFISNPFHIGHARPILVTATKPTEVSTRRSDRRVSVGRRGALTAARVAFSRHSIGSVTERLRYRMTLSEV
jgi:hypothetical protein